MTDQSSSQTPDVALSQQVTQQHKSYEIALSKTKAQWEDINKNPSKYLVLTGERPTGPLHIGHYFGTLKNRVNLQSIDVPMWIVIADYQVLTDRDSSATIQENVYEVLADYLAVGLDPENKQTKIFVHSYISSLNQLLIPFLSLLSVAELDRNPTVKSEIEAAGLKSVNSLMYTYPVHQAADILFCHGTLVPGGKDQLPHLEVTREVVRRFNDRYSKKKAYFKPPEILLSQAPHVLGLDGQKMSKSRNNSIYIKMSEDETAKLIKSAKTDSDRNITYDPVNRPEVANLLELIQLCTGEDPAVVAGEIGDKGGGTLKARLTEALNEYFKAMRLKRQQVVADKAYLQSVLQKGNQLAEERAHKTLREVQELMGMKYY